MAVLRMALDLQVVTKPVVVRLRGSGEGQETEILGDWLTKHEIHVEPDYTKACQKAVEVARREAALSSASEGICSQDVMPNGVEVDANIVR